MFKADYIRCVDHIGLNSLSTTLNNYSAIHIGHIPNILPHIQICDLVNNRAVLKITSAVIGIRRQRIEAIPIGNSFVTSIIVLGNSVISSVTASIGKHFSHHICLLFNAYFNKLSLTVKSNLKDITFFHLGDGSPISVDPVSLCDSLDGIGCKCLLLAVFFTLSRSENIPLKRRQIDNSTNHSTTAIRFCAHPNIFLNEMIVAITKNGYSSLLGVLNKGEGNLTVVTVDLGGFFAIIDDLHIVGLAEVVYTLHRLTSHDTNTITIQDSAAVSIGNIQNVVAIVGNKRDLRDIVTGTTYAISLISGQRRQNSHIGLTFPPCLVIDRSLGKIGDGLTVNEDEIRIRFISNLDELLLATNFDNKIVALLNIG